MIGQEKYITQEDLGYTLDAITALVEALRKEIVDNLTILEMRLLALEKQVAVLTLSLGEQAAAIDAIVGVLVEGTDKEEDFLIQINAARDKLFSVLQSNTNQGAEHATPAME